MTDRIAKFIFLCTFWVASFPIYAQETTTSSDSSRATFGPELAFSIQDYNRWSSNESNELLMKITLLKFWGNYSNRHIGGFDVLSFVGYNDPHNNEKFNVSITPIISAILSRAILLNEYPWFAPKGTRFYQRGLSFLVLNFLNSNHHFLLFEPRYKSDFLYEGGMGISILIRNSTDMFLFRREKWMRISPALGLGIMLNGHLFEFGVRRNIDFSHNKIGTEKAMFVALSFNFARTFLEGME